MYDDTTIDDEPFIENEFDTISETVMHDSANEDIQVAEIDELSDIEQPQLRRSPRNHQAVGHRIEIIKQ